MGYFNPRSRVGNDAAAPMITTTAINFNPRSRVGNDKDERYTLPESLKISIHVPAWGTTLLLLSLRYLLMISIHVPAWGTTPSYDFT